jgi:hypothetical protein
VFVPPISLSLSLFGWLKQLALAAQHLVVVPRLYCLSFAFRSQFPRAGSFFPVAFSFFPISF